MKPSKYLSNLSVKALKKISKRLKERKVVSPTGLLYLVRYYLLRKSWHNLPFSVYIHHFNAPDWDRSLHDHPWIWGLSFIVSGGYVEERFNSKTKKIDLITRNPWRINYLRGSDFHRIKELKGDVWTIFVSGKRTKKWGFMSDDGQYLEAKDERIY